MDLKTSVTCQDTDPRTGFPFFPVFGCAPEKAIQDLGIGHTSRAIFLKGRYPFCFNIFFWILRTSQNPRDKIAQVRWISAFARSSKHWPPKWSAVALMEPHGGLNLKSIKIQRMENLYQISWVKSSHIMNFIGGKNRFSP